jgi:hypothetical protein
MTCLVRSRTLARQMLSLIAAAGLALALPSLLPAQTIGGAFAPGCGAGTSCSTARFSIVAPGGGLTLNSLFLQFLDGSTQFEGEAGTGTYVAQDDIGPFGGFSTVSAGGATLFINFLDSGDPENPGFPMVLGSGSTGYVEVGVSSASPTAPFAFSYGGETSEGSFEGTVSAVPPPVTTAPEPGTGLLLISGLAAVGLINRRWRRNACARGTGRST